MEDPREDEDHFSTGEEDEGREESTNQASRRRSSAVSRRRSNQQDDDQATNRRRSSSTRRQSNQAQQAEVEVEYIHNSAIRDSRRFTVLDWLHDNTRPETQANFFALIIETVASLFGLWMAYMMIGAAAFLIILAVLVIVKMMTLRMGMGANIPPLYRDGHSRSSVGLDQDASVHRGAADNRHSDAARQRRSSSRQRNPSLNRSSRRNRSPSRNRSSSRSRSSTRNH